MSTNWSTLLFFELNSEKSDYFSIWGKIYPCQINSNLCVVGKKKVFIHACTGNFFILTALRICFHPPCNQILKIGFQLTQCILPLSFLVIGFTFGALTRHWGLDQETRREGWRSHIPLHLLQQASHWRHCCFVRHILRACIGWSFFSEQGSGLANSGASLAQHAPCHAVWEWWRLQGPGAQVHFDVGPSDCVLGSMAHTSPRIGFREVCHRPPSRKPQCLNAASGFLKLSLLIPGNLLPRAGIIF